MVNENLNGMVKDVYYGKTLRKSFARYQEILEMPNLLEVQKNSYQWFLDTGLREVFRDVEAITDYAGNLELSFIDYSMDEKPKYDVEECKARDATYAAPIKVRVRLRNKETEEIKEQEIFMGDFPLMTHSGTFVINGAERVIISQIVRSPGMYYTRTADKADNLTFATTVIPYRGAWLEYETDLSDIFYVRIDKNRKLPITCLIRAVGPKTDAEILEMFGEDERIVATMEKDSCKTYEEALLEIYRKLRPGEPPTVDSAESLLNATFYDPRRYDLSAVGRYKFNKKMNLATRISGHTLAMPVADPRTGEIIAEAGENLTRERARELAAKGVNEVVLDEDGKQVKVFSNNMVDMKGFVSFDPEACGVTEKVYFPLLQELLEQLGVSASEWIAAADISKSYGYQVLRGERIPGRDILLRTALSLSLGLKETQRLLMLGGCGALYPKIRRDAAVIFALNQKMTLLETEDLLASLPERSLYARES